MPLSPPPQLRNPFGKYSSPACHEDDKDDHGDNEDEGRHQITTAPMKSLVMVLLIFFVKEQFSIIFLVS